MLTMARPRTFDEDEVLASLLCQFWTSGYEGTALPDLEEASGLSRKSLYNAFGDKHTMFVRALRDFRGNAVRTLTAPLRESDASLAQIEALLTGLADLAGTPRGRLGCMICNTAREPVGGDPDVHQQVDGYFRSLETWFRRVIERGQAAGEIADRPAGELARLCLGAVVSISVLAKAGQPTKVMRSIANETVRALR